MSLVIKSWKVNYNPSEKEPYISITARQSGLIAFILSLIGMDPNVTFSLEHGKISYTASSWSGSKRIVVPMRNIATGFFGYTRPWQMALFLTVALLPFFFIGLIVGPLYYLLNKQLEFGFRATSGESFGIAFKRSIIEGQNIDEQAGEVILSLMEKHMQHHSGQNNQRIAA